MPLAQELPIDTTATAMQLAQEIFGNGVTVNSATYSGDNLSSGIYSSGDSIGAGVTPGDTGVILSTGYAEDFTNSSGTTNTNEVGNRSTNTSGVNGDSDFDAISAAGSRDASFLEVDFVPLGDLITVDFVLSSEEYPEYINSQYNDVIGVWVNGNAATISIGNGTASIGNINGVGGQANVYNDNTGDQFNTEMDGFTITLTFVAPVNTGVVNTLKVGVADVGDSSYDTNLLISGGSVQSTIVAQDDQLDIATFKDATLDVLDNDSSSGGTLTVTHINGVSVVAGDSVLLATGQNITLNANGTFTVESDGDNETVYFTYTVEDTSGNVDDAIVEINQTPCFVEGTRIETDKGSVLIEDLRVGMNVLTRDHGLQPIRWIGSSVTDGTGSNAPICIRKGVLGATKDLWLSPQHRVMIEGYMAELLYGELEVFIKAKDLIDDIGVTREPVEEVTYYHMLFDHHEVVLSDGVATESFLPGAQTLPGIDSEMQNELIELFPSLADDADSYGATARPIVRAYEAAPLMSAMAA